MLNLCIEIKPLGDHFLEDAVRIHQSVLDYTFNSRLGDKHLAFMYHQMSITPGCFTAVALASAQPVGVISGSFNMDETKFMIMKSFNLAQWGNLFFHLFKKPAHVVDIWNNGIVDRPISINEKLIPAILSTIAISPGFQGRGIGKLLVNSLEIFFKGRGIKYYRVDTLLSNHHARKFYNKLMFQEVAIRANSVILIKGPLG